MNHAPPTTDLAAPPMDAIQGRLTRALRNPYTLHRALGVVLWLALAVVLTWRGGA